MPRYVILRHELPSGQARGTHWDLMLESGGELRTWALACEPLSAGEIEAEQLPPHRLAYLDYEGPVSAGRGTVSRWDAGQYRLDGESGDELRITLDGHRLSGRAVLMRQGAETHFWRVSFPATPMTP